MNNDPATHSDEVEPGYVEIDLDPERWPIHPYTPTATNGQCLHRMPDRTLCQSTDPDAYLHHGVPR